MSNPIVRAKNKLGRTQQRGWRSAFGLRASYLDCLEHCRGIESAGVALDRDDLVDYTDEESTDDQLRLEDVLEELDWKGCSILHVGVGNSRFAERFAPGLRVLDGVTVSVSEKRHADGLDLPNYRVYLVSKYSRDLLLSLTEKYDFIVDNNLASFACCKFHFHLMMDTYVWSLRPGGRILTDQQGMDWYFENPRWRMSYRDLVGLERLFPLRAARVTDTVYSLTRV